MVVDDERDILTEVDEALTIEGYETTCVDNVDDALNVLRGNDTVDLIVTDLKMPGKSGLDLINQVRAEFGPGIGFVIISGSPESFGINMEEFQYLRKPVDIDKLLETVANALAQNADQNRDN